MGSVFPIFIFFCLVGWVHSNCNARPPEADVTTVEPSDLTTVAPIDDQPEGATNKTCMIPFLNKTMISWQGPHAAFLWNKQPIAFEDCRDLCLKNDSCSAMQYYHQNQYCELSTNNEYISLFIATCYAYPLTAYLKVTVPIAEQCSPLLLYRSVYGGETRDLVAGKKFTMSWIADDKKFRATLV